MRPFVFPMPPKTPNGQVDAASAEALVWGFSLEDSAARRLYVKQDGHRTVNIRVLTIRGQRYLPQLKEDLELLQQVPETYERNKTK